MFENLNDITSEKLVEYCQSHPEAAAWVKAYINEEGLTDKLGRPRKRSFIETRNAFARQFFPELIKNKVKVKTFYDLINEL